MTTRRFTRFLALPLSTLMVAACSASDPTPAASPADSGTPDTTPDGATSTTDYTVDYVAASAGLHTGKSQFQLEIKNKRDGSPATGLAASIELEPLMKMSSMMSHGNPVPADAVKESSTPGLYDCTLFFTMASVDMNGNPQGQWSLKVRVGTFDAAPIDLTVKPPAGADTTSVMLRNSSDMIASMGGAKMRSYPLFRDTLVAGQSGYVFTTFLATIQEGGMVWPPVTPGLKLVDEGGTTVQLTVQTVELEASADGATWAAMPCDAMSRCAATVTGLSKGVAGKIFVKMKLNGHDYTTDGAALEPGKNLATFSVTPP